MNNCPKCNYQRNEGDKECPHCGIIYEKHEAHLVKKGKKSRNIIERGRKVILICMTIVLVSILIQFLIPPNSIFPLVGFLIFGLLFYFTYRGYNWARICLFILLLLSGAGAYGGAMIFLKYYHSVGILIFIMGLLNLFIAFVLLLNKSVKVFINSGGENRLKINLQSVREVIKWLTCEEKIGKGVRRLLIVLSIPFFFCFIVPGILFWLLIRIVLWVIDGFKNDKKEY